MGQSAMHAVTAGAWTVGAIITILKLAVSCRHAVNALCQSAMAVDPTKDLLCKRVTPLRRDVGCIQ